MASAVKGEVKFGDFTLVLDINAWCDIEEMLGETINTMLQKDLVRSVRAARVIIYCGMRRNHPEVTLDMVGDLIGETGLAAAFEIVFSAINASLPAKKAVAGE